MTTPRDVLGLTESEWAVIAHRLGVPDAIADTLRDECDYNPDDVTDVCRALMRGNWGDANAISDAIVDAVLEDCIAGSTYLADLDDAVATQQVTPQQAASDKLSARFAAKKVTAYLGLSRPLQVPEA
jgi:hypothetical protein